MESESNVPPVFPSNSHSVPPVFPSNSHSVPPVFPSNSHSVPPVFPSNSHSVPPVFPPNSLSDVPVHFSRPAGTTQLGGKRTGRGAVNTLPAATPKSSRQLLFVLDSTSGARFLVDTGATVSAVPPSAANKATEYPSYDLLAANGTSIATYGTRTLNLDLGLPEKVIWSFIVADVRHPILGLDFLHSQDLLVDSRYQQLHHRPTTCTIKATPCAEVTPRITHVSPEPAYTSQLQEFPELTSTTPHSGRKRHNVMHRIITQGQPCFARPRRLPPERLQAAKREFEQLLQEALQHAMRNLPSTTPRHPLHKQTYIPPQLRTTEHVLVRHDAHRAPLQGPYDGPFRVLNRTPNRPILISLPPPHNQPSRRPLTQTQPQSSSAPHPAQSQPTQHKTQPQLLSSPQSAPPQPTQLHETQTQSPASPQPTQQHETQHESLEFPTLTPNIRQPPSPPSPQPAPPRPNHARAPQIPHQTCQMKGSSRPYPPPILNHPHFIQTVTY
ncbi:hypothetical protein Pcinc_025767 [Petrolisthes cinctipes]|uniref:Peptidase A2 domain-containing protein n=1 Tax=Petrolisthes cinctipes TaxID=88211 RepID=A0AAE1KBD5_PETCI|nr:hypothetical protein Pcinc_025767 [Petrolisthes cinctipes]